MSEVHSPRSMSPALFEERETFVMREKVRETARGGGGERFAFCDSPFRVHERALTIVLGFRV